MRALKSFFEKPTLIWFVLFVIFFAVFWSQISKQPMTESEGANYKILEKFADSTFPPKIDLIRKLPDWQGRVGYYALAGRGFHIFEGELNKLRLLSLVLSFAALFLFTKLGQIYLYFSRFNPIWISLATLIIVANPYFWESAFYINSSGTFLFFLLLATYLFRKDRIWWGAAALSMATLMDWIALLLAVAFVFDRILDNQSRVLRVERILAFLLPFVIGALPFLAWRGLVPEGEAREVWGAYWANRPLFRLDALYYMIALIPIYGLYYAWTWGLKARTREQMLGLICTGLSIPIYFIFPAKDEAGAPLGLIDQGLLSLSEQYKNLLLFVPWLVGMFLFMELLMLNVRDRSRGLRYFIVLFFAAQPFMVGTGDKEFLIVLPFLLLFSLSESLVGEEGKLS